MAETFNKKEKEKKRAKKKQDRDQRREDRKSNNDKGKSLDEMTVYIDEFGNFTDTPPDPKSRKSIGLDSIQLGAGSRVEESSDFTGVLNFFSDKGFGFIAEDGSREKIFVHSNQFTEPIKLNDKVMFEKEKTPKGLSAVNVRKIK